MVDAVVDARARRRLPAAPMAGTAVYGRGVYLENRLVDSPRRRRPGPAGNCLIFFRRLGKRRGNW